MNDRRTTDRAIVLGGGMAGLLAARVLADTYDEIIVLERDALPVTHQPRRGVPQGRHAHFLLSRGRQVLEELFPGFTAELQTHGAPTGDVLADTRMYLSGHLLQRGDSGLIAVSLSRAFLEGHIRDRVRALPGVTIVDRCDVAGLTASSDRRRVTGARVLRRADSSAEEVLHADLLVDATGRGSRAGAWLASLGYATPPEERVPIDLGYATRRYRLDDHALDGDIGILHGLTPTHPRGAGIARLEHGQLMVTLAGVRGDHPPVDPEGFATFARSLRFSDIHEAIRGAEPLDDPVRYRFVAGVRRRFDKLPDSPDGFLVVGDGVCSLNPIYGQGMSVAAEQALTLQRHLAHGPPRPDRFFRDISEVTSGPWTMAAGADLAFPGVEGRRRAAARVVGAYIARLHAAAAHDASLATAFVRVSGLVDPPQTLLRPRVIARVLCGGAPTASVPQSTPVLHGSPVARP